MATAGPAGSRFTAFVGGAALAGVILGATGCETLRANGETCIKGRDCESGLCRAGTCAPKPTNNPTGAGGTPATGGTGGVAPPGGAGGTAGMGGAGGSAGNAGGSGGVAGTAGAGG